MNEAWDRIELFCRRHAVKPGPHRDLGQFGCCVWCDSDISMQAGEKFDGIHRGGEIERERENDSWGEVPKVT